MMRRKDKNGATNSLSFIFVRLFVFFGIASLSRVLCQRDGARKRRLGVRNWNRQRWNRRGKKDGIEAAEAERNQPSAAMRGEEEESRQPRNQTVKLCTTQNERSESQDDWFVYHGRSFVIRFRNDCPRKTRANIFGILQERNF